MNKKAKKKSVNIRNYSPLIITIIIILAILLTAAGIALYYFNFRPEVRIQNLANEITKEKLEKSLVDGADWLLRMQEDTGRFQYWYDPKKEVFSKKTDDNFLRQAGTAFSMSLAYEYTGNKSYLDAVKKSINYLIQFKKTLNEDKAYFFFNKKAKLGGIALPMLSMLKLKSLLETKEYDIILKQSAKMIMYLQELYNTGQFKSTYVYRGDYNHEKTKGWESRIYPGEALYALAMMYKAFGDHAYKQSFDWAMDFYWKNSSEWNSAAFLPWTITASSFMYELTSELKYFQYAIFLADTLLTIQKTDIKDPEIGGFHQKASANTGSYMEGIADAIKILRLGNDQYRLERYILNSKLAYRWLIQLQMKNQDVKGLKYPDRALGGIRYSFDDWQLRIDNTQHTISAIKKGLDHIYNYK